MIWTRTRWRATSMKIDDPWRDLVPPSASDAITARRVDHGLPWGFFWAKSLENECLLVLRHTPASSPTSPLPRLKGVEMILTEGDHGGERMLVLRLVDRGQRDIFLSLCRDIVSSAGSAATEKEAVAVTLRRTWRWHLLLRGGAGGRLTVDEQKGLIGELIVLERLILPYLSPSDAVSTWLGPTGAPKDFEIGRIAVESKARRGGAAPYVAISSEHQLDDAGVDRLFLHVVELDREQAPDKPASTLTEVVDRCRTAIAERDVGAVDLFEGLLIASGFSWEDDYSDTRWAEGKHSLFAVAEGFPRLGAVTCPVGVSNVKYTIDLGHLGAFRVSLDDLVDSLRGERHAD